MKLWTPERYERGIHSPRDDYTMDRNARQIKPGTPWSTIWKARDFWATQRPSDHFLTPATACGALIDSKVSEHMEELGLDTLLEIGPGDAPSNLNPHTHLTVDRRPTPGIHDTLVAQWRVDQEDWEPDISRSWGSKPLFVLAVEFFDDIPCPVATRKGFRIYHLSPNGSSEQLVADRELEWARQWWPAGSSLDIGHSRDVAWKWLVERLPAGSAIAMIDYGHIRSGRPSGTTLAAHRGGVWIDPGDPGGNLTAHVAVDALAAAGEAAGARTIELCRLRDLDWPVPPAEGLAALGLRSQRELLSAPDRFGDFWWLLQVVGDNGGRA
ncbi:hypothetical protein [Mariniluteicoccus endophyticus]